MLWMVNRNITPRGVLNGPLLLYSAYPCIISLSKDLLKELPKDVFER